MSAYSTLSRRSSTTTSRQPRADSCSAAASPAGPPPTISAEQATGRPVPVASTAAGSVAAAEARRGAARRAPGASNAPRATPGADGAGAAGWAALRVIRLMDGPDSDGSLEAANGRLQGALEAVCMVVCVRQGACDIVAGFPKWIDRQCQPECK
jgi:hypothetical protein